MCALNRTHGVKIVQLLVCIGSILHRVKSCKGDKQYHTWNSLWVSFRPYDHYDCCTI